MQVQATNIIPRINVKESDAKLREQTDAFEALILKTLLDVSLHFDNPLYPKEAGSEIYEGMYKDSLGKQLAGNFGYSELLFNYLKQK
ncbi:MAG: Rod binding protein [Helicobacter sp.]|nr:Rod binding protein [Helicobacter sp.]